MLLKCTMSNAAPCIDFEPTPLSERLVELREATGMSQAYAAASADLDELTLIRIELGQVPTPHEMTALVRLFSSFDFDEATLADLSNLDAGFVLAGVA